MPINYEGTIWRPPSEANSLILQTTIGCSHNKCIFCVSYRNKVFRIRPFSDIKKDIDKLVRHNFNPRRVFLADGNALVMPTNELAEVLSYLYENFSNLERVGIYGGAKDIIEKKDDLPFLKEQGLGIIYLGFETGNKELLKFIKKGVTPTMNLEASSLVKKANILLSTIILLGLAGANNKKLSQQHIIDTATIINKTNPDYLAALTLMTPKGTEIYEMVQQNRFTVATPNNILDELILLIDRLDNLSGCLFRTNHASNYVTIGGILSQERKTLLELLMKIKSSKRNYSFKPEYLRGL